MSHCVTSSLIFLLLSFNKTAESGSLEHSYQVCTDDDAIPCAFHAHFDVKNRLLDDLHGVWETARAGGVVVLVGDDDWIRDKAAAVVVRHQVSR